MRLVDIPDDLRNAFDAVPWTQVRPGIHERFVTYNGLRFCQTQIFCKDCRDDMPEPYHLRDDLWARVAGDGEEGYPEGILCLKCLERRMGRPLTVDDLTQSLIVVPGRPCGFNALAIHLHRNKVNP